MIRVIKVIFYGVGASGSLGLLNSGQERILATEGRKKMNKKME